MSASANIFLGIIQVKPKHISPRHGNLKFDFFTFLSVLLICGICDGLNAELIIPKTEIVHSDVPILKTNPNEATLKIKETQANVNLSKPQKIELSEARRRSSYTFPYVYPSSPTPEGPDSPGLDCICVPIYACIDNQIIIDIAALGNDLRHGLGWQCGNRHFVCCPLPTLPPPASTALPGFTPRCGTLNPNGINARLLGVKDAETQFGEYPWMAAVLESKLVNGIPAYKFVCGGALIWPSVVITAGHCVKGKTAGNLVVRLGEWDTQSTNEFYPHQDISGEEIIVHPQYYAGGLYYDVALVFLSTPAILAPHIDTICLPEILPNYESNSCWATGWGKNEFDKAGSYQVILKEVELPIVPKPICENALRKSSLGSNFNLHSSFLCAGGAKDLDTCVGDGGGGLVCPSTLDPWRYVLSGLVSWGVRCGDHGVPGVYVDISKVRGWIDLTISGKIPSYDINRVTALNDAKRRG